MQKVVNIAILKKKVYTLFFLALTKMYNILVKEIYKIECHNMKALLKQILVLKIL